MKFVLYSKLALSVTVCVLLASCSQAESTPSEYVGAKITTGATNQQTVEIAAPEEVQSPKATQSPDNMQMPELVIPGEVSESQVPTQQKGSNDKTSAPSYCEGVDDNIAGHFDGLLKCEELSEVVANVREHLKKHDVEKLLFAVMMEWKNEHCIAPIKAEDMPLNPLKEGEGPTYKHPIIEGELPEVDAESLVLKREYVPCAFGSVMSSPEK